MPRLTAPPRAAGRPPVGAPSGFTLIELVVTMTLLVLVGSLLSTLLVSQLRLFERAQGATAVQRDLRMGMALLPLDLRGASRERGDLRVLADTAIELNATIGSAIVCEVNAGTAMLVLPPRGLARNTLAAWYAEPAAQDFVSLLVLRTTGAEGDTWPRTTLRTDPTTAPSTACVGAPFTDAALDPPGSKPRVLLTLDSLPLAAQVRRGLPLRILRRVRYQLYLDGARWYLGYAEQVRGTWTPLEKIAGPFAAGRAAGGPGVSFAYFDTAGVRLTPPVDGRAVGRVDLTLRARAAVRGGPDSVVVRDSVAVRVALRNRL